MKIITLISSGRKSGNTSRFITQIESELQKIGKIYEIPMVFERIQLSELNLEFCCGCRICFDKGETCCPLNDDLLKLRDRISGADGIILGSPVYVEDVNGIMKNWIDRMAFNSHRPAFAGKAAAVITTSGGGSTMHAVNTMARALNTWGLQVAFKAKFRAESNLPVHEIKARYHRKIKQTAKTLFDSIQAQSVGCPSFQSLMYFKIQQKYWQKNSHAQNNYDYSYWEDKGWVDSSCKYYIPICSGNLKVMAARLAGALVALFFI
ncbi:flavodoxin family protein [Acetobacterium bakii]|uniref:flavodoxin family protein n=1 Tax=Acetobacterium bakii TaxID=52689 RepID=UPI00067FAB0F|nr:flavodoxin family protein [Acetobacterium bakii]